MDIKVFVAVCFLSASSSFADNMFSVIDTAFLDNPHEAEGKCLTYSFHEGCGENSYSLNKENEIDDETLEMSAWLAYQFLRYNLCERASDESIKTPFQIFGLPMKEFLAKRCHLVVFPPTLSDRSEEFVVYKFYHKVQHEFFFALYCDVRNGCIEMNPRRNPGIKKLFNMKGPYQFFFFLDNDEERKQREVIKMVSPREMVNKPNPDFEVIFDN